MGDPSKIPFLKAQTKVGDWKLEKHLGSGGQGEVWRAFYKGRPGKCAVKISFGRSDKDRARFLSEVETLTALDHPHIVKPIAHGQATIDVNGVPTECPYYVVPLAEGTLDSQAMMARGLQQGLTWFLEVLQGASHMHAQRLLHRDLKPSNVLVLERGTRMVAVLSDLGLAKLVEEQGGLTATHELVGTKPYMAPEQVYGVKPSERTDIYALGKTLEFIVTGQVPNPLETRPTPEGPHIAEVAREALDAVIRRATAQDPSARYASVDELAADVPQLVLDVRQKPRIARIVSVPAMPIVATERLALWDCHDGQPEREVYWEAGPYAFVWLAPAVPAERTWTPHELVKLEQGGRAMLPRLFEADRGSWSRNPHGFVVFPLPDRQRDAKQLVDSATLATREGHVWAINGDICRVRDEYQGATVTFAPVAALEAVLARGLRACMQYIGQNLQVPPPYAWAAGIQWISGIRLGLGANSSRRFSQGSDTDQVVAQGVINGPEDVDAALLPLFSRIWDAFGADRVPSR